MKTCLKDWSFLQQKTKLKKKTNGSRTNYLVFYFLHICSPFEELKKKYIRYESTIGVRFLWFISGAKNQESKEKRKSEQYTIFN